LIRQRGFTLLEMLAALAVLAVCSSVLIVAFGQSAGALQQVQRTDRLSLAARSILDEASAGALQAGDSQGQWSGVHWHLAVSALPPANSTAGAWRLDLEVDDGAHRAHYSTLQVRTRGAAQ